jgi:hypothetical protein
MRIAAMGLRGIIMRSDRRPLGSVEEVKHHISDVFPGVSFTYEAEEPHGAAMARKNTSLFMRFWLSLFGVDGQYPNHCGYFERTTGGAVEFYFVAQEPVI